MFETSQIVDADARRLALEIIATLVNIKRTAAERLLTPCGVPADLVQRFLKERDPSTGDKRSKREAGTVILDALAERDLEADVIRRIIKHAAEWSDFHLAQDEYRARSVAMKAREMLGGLHEAEARERLEQERRREEDLLAQVHAQEVRRRERIEQVRRESELLLAQFDQTVASGEPQQRGYFLEDLLIRAFNIYGIPATKSFRRNSGGEQIDGAFEFEGWYFIAECRWRDHLSDIRQLDGLAGQLGRSGRQTMGLFLSINRWSGHVVDLLKQNPNKNIILMDGIDLRAVLSRNVGLSILLKEKLSALNFHGNPYRSASDIIG